MQKKTEDAISGNFTKVSFISLFWEFFKIGLFTIGGGAAMIPQMQQTVAVDKKWLSEEDMLDCVAVGQSLPGVIAVNMATYVGYKQRGMMGAIVATVGVTIPAFLAIIIALAFLDVIGDNRIVEGAFTGVKAAVCGLIIVTAVRLIKQICRSGDRSRAKIVFTVIMSALSFLAVGFFGVTAILVIIISIIAGIVFYRTTEMNRQEADRK